MNQPRPPTIEYLKQRRDEIFALAEHYGVSNIREFGSVARGEANATSDVDFLVTAQAGTTLFDLSGFWLDLKDLMGCEVSLVSDQQFLDRIEGEAVVL